MFEYRTRTETDGGCKFYQQDILLLDYTYEGDIDVHACIDYNTPGFGLVIAEFANDISESANIYVIELSARNEYRVIKKEYLDQRTVANGFFDAGKDINVPTKDLDLSFKFTDKYRVEVYSEAVLLFSFGMDYDIAQYKIGFYSSAGNVIKNCIIYSETPSNWVHNIWNGYGGRIDWIKNGFNIQECEYPCDVECQNIELDAGKYYLSYTCTNPDMEFFALYSSKKIALKYEENYRGAMRYFSKDTPILVTLEKTDSDGKPYLVTETKMFEEIYDPHFDDISENRWIADSRFDEQNNIIKYDVDGYQYIELEEPSTINLKIRGKLGKVTNIAIKKNKNDAYVETTDNNINREGSHIKIDPTKIKTVELEVEIGEIIQPTNDEDGSFILKSDETKLRTYDFNIGQFVKQTRILLDTEKQTIEANELTNKYLRTDTIYLLCNMDAIITKFIITDYEGNEVNILLQKTFMATLPKTVSSPILCLKTDDAPLDLSSDYRRICEYSITTDIFNKYNELKLSKTPILNKGIRVAGVREGIKIYTGQNVLEETAPEFDLLSPAHYEVDYVNNVVKLPQAIKDLYKYILVEYENCDDYYYWFTNYHRQLVDLDTASNIYLDTDYLKVDGAVTVYGIPSDAILKKGQLYDVPNRNAIVSVDYCASKYDEIPGSAFDIFSSNRVIIDTEVRKQYKYLIIDYLKNDSYAINEEDENYRIEIATDEDKVKILYDANELEVTNPYKGLTINTDAVIKDDFIVLRKDRML